jgi:ABC-type polysaccharide/polyol phosphate export permease
MYDLSFVARAASVSPLLANLYMLNPMAVIITGYRAMTMPGMVFPWTPYTVAGLLLPLVLLWIAYGVFQRSEKNFADML